VLALGIVRALELGIVLVLETALGTGIALGVGR